MSLIKKACAALTVFSFMMLSAAPVMADQAYRAKPGENLYTIAKEQNIGVDRLLAKNPFISDPLFVVPYQVVIIPELKPGKTYIVKSGDSLESIARDHGIEPKDLVEYNSLEKNSVFPGQVIAIPPSAVAPKVPQGEKPPGATAPPPLPPASKKTVYQNNIPKLMAQFPGSIFLSGKRDKKVVALTFDDGPDDIYTPRILDILDQQGVKATFFLVGSRIKDYPAVVSKLVASGHQVAGHGWSHTDLRSMDRGEVKKELADTGAAFRAATGLEPLMLRPPYGGLSEDAMDELVDLGYTAVEWSSDSQDWYSRSADRVLVNTLTDTRPGSIILMHSTGVNLEDTVKALPELIYTLKAQGYSFVTVAELLGRPAYRQTE